MRGLSDMCRACFDGDEDTLQRVLRQHAFEDLCGVDKHGLTALHIAAMRDHSGCVRQLLQAGFRVKVKSTAGWVPFEEALCYSSKNALKVLVDEHRRVLSSRMKERLLQLKEVFCDMPDCAFQVRLATNHLVAALLAPQSLAAMSLQKHLVHA